MHDENNTTSSAANLVTSALVGVAVALALIIPPPIHILTGPLGPLIGGVVAGGRARVGAGGAAVVGGMMGVLVCGVVGSVGALLLWRFAPLDGDGVLAQLRQPQILAAALMGVWLYTTVLGFGGALLGGHLKRSS